MAKADLTAQRLRELLHYDPETGVFTWLRTSSHRRSAGMTAGTTTSLGYRFIGVEGHRYLAHRLAWLYVSGAWPEFDIDHVNGQRSDNRIVNLRDAPTSINCQNQRAQRKDGRLLGAFWIKTRRKWRAQIKKGGRTYLLGDFHTQEEAHAVYLEAKRRLHEGCTI